MAACTVSLISQQKNSIANLGDVELTSLGVAAYQAV